MSGSNSYSFSQNTFVDTLFREAYERIGITGNQLSFPMINSAYMSSNLILTDWMGKGPYAWMRKRGLLNVISGQMTYILPQGMTALIDVIYTMPTPLANNITATSSGVGAGAVTNLYAPLPNAGCTLSTPNGWIQYSYSSPQQVCYIGLMGLQGASLLTLEIQYSLDNVSWVSLYLAPPVNVYAGEVTWIVLNAPVLASNWKIIETNGAVISLNQMYLGAPSFQPTSQPDRTLGSLSSTEWMQIANKAQTGSPSSYFFDAQTIPTITLWPIPSFNAGATVGILYTAYFYPADVLALMNSFDVPRRFWEALIAELSYRLCVKFKSDNAALLQLLKVESGERFLTATQTEQSNYPLRFQPDFQEGSF